MRHLIFGSVVAAFLSGAAWAQGADIESVITRQIEAFKVDDFATAFSFASPAIRGIFQTPENFGRMVAQGYPMVWRPADVEYLALRDENGRFAQRVRIVDGEGRTHVLDYFMVETPNGWKISGVVLVPDDALSA